MASTPSSIPGAEELQDQARATAGRCGVGLSGLAAHRATTSPVNGEHLHSLEWAEATAVDSAVERAQQAFRHVADGARACARCRRQAAGRAADGAQDATWPP